MVLQDEVKLIHCKDLEHWNGNNHQQWSLPKIRWIEKERLEKVIDIVRRSCMMLCQDVHFHHPSMSLASDQLSNHNPWHLSRQQQILSTFHGEHPASVLGLSCFYSSQADSLGSFFLSFSLGCASHGCFSSVARVSLEHMISSFPAFLCYCGMHIF